MLNGKKKMVRWIIESDIFSERSFVEMVETFKKYNIPYDIVRVIPFIHEIDGKKPTISENEKVVVYGSIGTQKLAIKHNWFPGVWTSDNFSETKMNLPDDKKLNSDFISMKLSEVWDKFLVSKEFGFEFFIKPNTDTKEFAGTVMEREEFQLWLYDMNSIGYLENNDFEVVICEPKHVSQEYRFVVVDGKISSGSLYKNFGRAYMDKKIDPEAELFVNQLCKINNPADVYVIDVGMTHDGYKVIEYNTFNSAGLYLCDVEKIILDINKFVERT